MNYTEEDILTFIQAHKWYKDGPAAYAGLSLDVCLVAIRGKERKLFKKTSFESQKEVSMFYFVLEDSSPAQPCSGCSTPTKGFTVTDEEMKPLGGLQPIDRSILPTLLEKGIGKTMCLDCYKKTISINSTPNEVPGTKEPKRPELPRPWPPNFSQPPNRADRPSTQEGPPIQPETAQ